MLVHIKLSNAATTTTTTTSLTLQLTRMDIPLEKFIWIVDKYVYTIFHLCFIRLFSYFVIYIFYIIGAGSAQQHSSKEAINYRIIHIVTGNNRFPLKVRFLHSVPLQK